jgi:putative flippase GtrA
MTKLKAATASVLATVFDVATLLVLVQLARVEAGIAAAIGCLVGGSVNFLLSRRWVFAARKQRAAGKQLALYGLLVVAGSAVLAGTLVHVATATLGAPLVVAKGAAAALVFVLWSYPISARVVFARA